MFPSQFSDNSYTPEKHQWAVKKAQVKLCKYTTGKMCAGGSGTRNVKPAEGNAAQCSDVV